MVDQMRSALLVVHPTRQEALDTADFFINELKVTKI